ncbi:Histone-arginine methyltransferase CARM1 [Lemmus lemmus]
MFPTIGDIHLAPFTDEQLYMEQFTKANFWSQPSFPGVDLSALRGAAVDEYFRQPVVDTFDIRILMAKSVKYTGTTPSPPPGSHYTSPAENMWNMGSTYNLSSGVAVAGMPTAYDLSSVIAGGSSVGHNLIPLGSSGAQGGSGGSSAHYTVNNQFTIGGPAISMASPMSLPTNTMHYGS